MFVHVLTLTVFLTLTVLFTIIVVSLQWSMIGSANSKAQWYSWFETALLVVLGAAQFYLIKAWSKPAIEMGRGV